MFENSFSGCNIRNTYESEAYAEGKQTDGIQGQIMHYPYPFHASFVIFQTPFHRKVHCLRDTVFLIFLLFSNSTLASTISLAMYPFCLQIIPPTKPARPSTIPIPVARGPDAAPAVLGEGLPVAAEAAETAEPVAAEALADILPVIGVPLPVAVGAALEPLPVAAGAPEVLAQPAAV